MSTEIPSVEKIAGNRLSSAEESGRERGERKREGGEERERRRKGEREREGGGREMVFALSLCFDGETERDR